MDAIATIMQSRQEDVNPFREILKQMGALAPNLKELGGVPPMPARPANAMPGGGGGNGDQMRQLIAQLIAKGVPQEQAIEQARQMLAGRGN